MSSQRELDEVACFAWVNGPNWHWTDNGHGPQENAWLAACAYKEAQFAVERQRLFRPCPGCDRAGMVIPDEEGVVGAQLCPTCEGEKYVPA